MLEEALAYAKRGWPVFPCHTDKKPRTKHGFKDATTDPDQIRKWWEMWPSASIGIPTGAQSGIVVLDVDPEKGGLESMDLLVSSATPIPDTPLSLTGGGGYHYLFSHSGEQIPNSASFIAPGLDIRGDGGYFIAPPSLHPSGCPYEWEISSDPWNTRLAPIPDWLLTLIGKQEKTDRVRWDADISDGQRNATLFRLGSQMRRAGADYDAIYAALSAHNAARCKPPLDDKEVQKIARQPLRYEPERREQQVETELPKTSYGDVFNAELLILRSGEDLRYCHEWSSWYLWKETHWVKDRDDEVYDYARNALKWALDIAFDQENEKLMRHIIKSRSHRGLGNMLAQAGTMAPIRTLPEYFDRHPYLLNCRNGTVDLRDGNLLPHERSLLLTKCAPVDYEPDAKSPRWEEFLSKIMGASEPIAPDDTELDMERKEALSQSATELIVFLQRAVGYSLYGSTQEKALMIPYGEGDNGKTTFIETISGILGEGYAMRTPTTTFIAKRDGNIPNDVAQLKGIRFAYAAEPPQNRRLDASLIKDLTGGDTVSARFMRGEFFTFRPECTLWMSTNHKPPTSDTGNALWSRIKLIPFDVQIPKEEQDKDLRAKLLEEAPGILAWAVQGCLDWQLDGLAEPEAVTAATSEYREENDTVEEFIREACSLIPNARVKSNILYEKYRKHCEQVGIYPINNKDFAKSLAEKGIEKIKNSGMWFIGIGIIQDEEDPRYR